MTNRAHWPGLQGPTLAAILPRDSNSFGVIRLLLAATVVISHAYMMHAGTPAADPVLQFTGYTSGQHAVQGFFVLSGLMVASSFAQSRGLIDFVSARVLRIFPGLIVCVLLTAFVLGPLVSTLAPGSYFSSETLWRYIGLTLSLKTGSAPLPGVFENVPMANIVNLSLWTLKFEVVCYALLGLCGTLAILSPWPRQARLALAGCVAAFVLWRHPGLIESNIFIDSVRYFTLFFGTGVLAYAAREHFVINGYVLGSLAAIFAASIGSPATEFAAAALLAYGMIWLATFSFGPLGQSTSRHDLSYGTYIYGVPVSQTLLYFWPSIGITALIVLSFLIVVPLAAMSWLWVERPAIRLRPALRDSIEKLATFFRMPVRQS
jgi:peptidoglycan/LPS O-acetylase OafA/YrhL